MTLNKTVQELTKRHNIKVEKWMLWQGWGNYQIGCNFCLLLGPEAKCWGKTECHGWEVGCGCINCEEKHKEFSKRFSMV